MLPGICVRCLMNVLRFRLYHGFYILSDGKGIVYKNKIWYKCTRFPFGRLVQAPRG